MKRESESQNWSYFHRKKETYIRAKLVSVESEHSYSKIEVDEKSSFEKEKINSYYLLTFQEGTELKTYYFSEKPLKIGEYYIYTIKNGSMTNCYYSEENLKYEVKDKTRDINIFLGVFLFTSLIFLGVGITAQNSFLTMFMGSGCLILGSLLYLVSKKSSNLANKIIKKLKS